MAKYRVYGNYIFSKVLGEYEADSEEETIEKALDEAECNATLCMYIVHRNLLMVVVWMKIRVRLI